MHDLPKINYFFTGFELTNELTTYNRLIHERLKKKLRPDFTVLNVGNKCNIETQLNVNIFKYRFQSLIKSDEFMLYS